MAVLINGNGYSPVTAQQDADLYAGIMGNATTILGVGEKMTATIVDASTVRIADGEVVSQGRRIHIDAGEYDDFTIPTGISGVTRYYIIGYRLYSDAGGNELCEKFVRQVANESTVIQEASLRDGASESYVSLYRVTQVGFTVATVEMLAVKPVNGVVGLVYPVGSIYISVNNANPSTFFGGTWEAWGSGRVPVGVNASDSNFNAVEKTGGASTHTLTVAQMPTHMHSALFTEQGVNTSNPSRVVRSVSFGTNTAPSEYVGGNQAHNNLQPYITCYMWKRTA